MPLDVVADSESSIREFLEGHRYTYSTKDHPKAKGVHFTMALPNSWAAAEGARPNIVQRFVDDGGRGFAIVLITTKDLPLPPGTVLTDQDQRELFAPSELRGTLPPGATFVGAQATEIEATPAGILEYKLRSDRAGMSVLTYWWTLSFLSDNTLVQVQFSVGDIANSEDDVARRMAEFKPLFTLIANSIVFPDKWTVAPQIPPTPSVTQLPTTLPDTPRTTLPLSFDNPPRLILSLVVGFIVAWGLGLTPPLVIRYAIIRRPLSRKAASWIAAGFSGFFWIAFRAINHALGEEPGRGFVWILVFFVAWWLMSRGYESAATSQPNSTPPA